MTLESLTLSPARRADILRQGAKRRRPAMRWTAGKIVLAAALTIVLTVSAFAAVSPALREALAKALGSFTEQSQPISGVAVEDNGIEVRPVSALSDSGMIKVYCEVQDKTGDRLSGDMDINAHIYGLPLLGGGIGSTEVISYDQQTRTALVEVFETGRELTDAAPASIQFFSFQPRESIEETGLSFPRELLQNTGLKTMFDDPERRFIETPRVLVPEQTPMALDTEYARLSSVGFGDDDKLHIQTASVGDANHKGSGLYTFVQDPLDDDRYFGGGRRYFQRDGVWYCDQVFDVSPDELAHLTVDDLDGSYNLRGAVTGAWSADITIEPVKSITYSTNTQVGGALVKEIRVSPISVVAISKSKATILGHRPTYAMLRDGTKLILTDNCIQGLHTTDEAHDQWTFNEPLDPADIVSLNFDGVTVPLQ